MDKLAFRKDWTNKEDFPTVETDEGQVRADLQYHPDAIKDFINNLIDTLASESGAGNIGYATATGALKNLQTDFINVWRNYSVQTSMVSPETPSASKLPTSAAVQAAINAAVIEAGAGDMTKAVYDPQSKNQDAFAYADSAVSTHEAKQNNPHSVTKSQVGLGNVDNTSDLAKPISTATQAALDQKYGVGGCVPITDGGTGQTTWRTSVTVSFNTQYFSDNSTATVYYYPYLKMCFLRVRAITTAALDDGLDVECFHLDNASLYAPSYYTALSTFVSGSSDEHAECVIHNADGLVKLKPINKQIPSGKSIYISGFWFAPNGG